jgi:uncharacterized repeat protein (TIGR01451 family)
MTERILGPTGDPRRRWRLLAVIAAGLVAIGLISSVAIAALVTDSGTHSVIVPNKETSSPLVDIGNANIKYIGSSAQDQASGTGLFDPFVRLQNDTTEQGYNTDGTVEFDTKTGQWTHAIKASAIPIVDCDLEGPGTATCWELFVDINDANNAKYIALTDLEIYFATGPGAATLTGYPFTSPPAGTTVTKEYDFSGEIQIHDVNQGSGRGDLLYLVPTDGHPFTADTYFVLYSKWGSSTVAPDLKTFASDGGFEEWKVRKAPNVSILKVANPVGPVNAGATIGFDITVSNTGAAAAPTVSFTDNLPGGAALNWTLNPAFTGCSIAGSQGSQVLTCSFSNVAAGATIGPIHVQSATTSADCGIVNNTATLTAGGVGSSTASVTVNCAAIMILKQSTKTGNPLVNTGTDPTPASTADNAEFGVDGPDADTTADFSVTDNSAADGDSTYGEVCVAGLAPGTYTITETRAPLGYGSGNPAFDATAAAVAGTNCGANQPAVADRAVFRNPPLADLLVRVDGQESGEIASSISCVEGATSIGSVGIPTPVDPAVLDVDDLDPGTYVCTVVIDP